MMHAALRLAVTASTISFCLANTLLAQKNATMIPVPFVGCKSDGQVGPIEAPKARLVSIPVSHGIADKLAVYEAARGFDVIAPRGWNCFEIYGSSGSTLLVSEQPFDTDERGYKEMRADGSALVATFRDGETSGRFAVAEIVARVFPAFRSYAENVAKDDDQPPFHVGPWPADVLRRIGQNMVEYRTSGSNDGLGTWSELKKNADPIDGVAILTGAEHDLSVLAVRLPSNQRSFAPIIVREFERAVLSRGQTR
jgi:hypothetical protein